MPWDQPTPHQTYSSHWQNVQLILFSYSAAVLRIFFALKEEGHYNGCARHKPKHKPHFWPQTKRITPMLHRKWIIWDLSYCNFFHRIRNNYFLLEAMALHCTKVESSSYYFMLKYEKLFSGNCTQFSSQLLNCPRWGVRVSLGSPETPPCNPLIPTAARGWAAPAWLRWKLWRQNFQKM